MKRIERDILELLGRGEDLVLATILTNQGSTPRAMGAQMVMGPRGRLLGTIGGGRVEADVIEAAREIREKKGATIRDYDLAGHAGADMDLICGGSLSVLIEHLAVTPEAKARYEAVVEALEAGSRILSVTLLPETSPSGPLKRFVVRQDGSMAGDIEAGASVAGLFASSFAQSSSTRIVNLEGGRYLVEPVCSRGTVFIFGAGHVSLELARLTAHIEFRTVVLDDRSEFANKDRFPMADEVHVSVGFHKPLQALSIGPDSYLVIVTRGHSHDKTMLAQALQTSAGYIGMIGSRRKRAEIYATLLQEGFSRDSLERVHCPIGLEIGAQTPEEIAVSITAELIRARSAKSEAN
ncbi:MAG: XdhC family protein [Syntrophobacteraceae bacterium]|nr:XdhC family protein [Syntrophobacteraceae bacterium]